MFRVSSLYGQWIETKRDCASSVARSTLVAPRSRMSSALRYGSRSEERRVGKECRSRCDWSSDVCSSDLVRAMDRDEARLREQRREVHLGRAALADVFGAEVRVEIGRASCRERV